MPDYQAALSSAHRRALAAGQHETVAAELVAAGEFGAAGWVLEQIWDFEPATAHFLRAGAYLDALRCALEVSPPGVLHQVLLALQKADSADLQAAVAMLERRGRHLEAASLLEHQSDDPRARARALCRGGAELEAATLLAKEGLAREALDVLPLRPVERRPDAPALAPRQVHAHALAAELCWELGDAEATVRHAQTALRSGYAERGRDNLVRLLARALESLGHDFAAQVALKELGEANVHADETNPLRGRYHLTTPLPACFAGAAYAGIDRANLREVEVHLLLHDIESGGGPSLEVREKLQAFAQVALAAARLQHPAIREIIHLDPRAGLLILPRAANPPLRHLIRPPGMHETPARPRALVSFLLEGLVAGHHRGLVHGSLLPSQIVCDAVGRPCLGPFGAHHLAGLVATQTGTLEELLVYTAPEVRAGAPPTTKSDVYSICAVYRALLVGEHGGEIGEQHELPEHTRTTLQRGLCETPNERPTARALLDALRGNVADIRELERRDASSSSSGMRLLDERRIELPGVFVEAHPSWSDELLNALLACEHPIFQPVLDRDGNTYVLASWPEGTRRLDHRVDYRRMAPISVLDELPAPIAAAIGQRLAVSSWVVTPGDAWMLALDDLLTR